MSERLHVLSITDHLIPSITLDVIKPMLNLQQQGKIDFRLRYHHQYKEADIIWADTVVLCRNIHPEELDIIKLAKKHGKQLIYDIDDNFLALPIYDPVGRYHRNPIHLFVMSQMIKNADAVRIYSRPMEEFANHWNPNVFRMKGYFDFSLIEGREQEKHDKVRIVYATSRRNADTLAQICIPAVARVLERYPDKVEFYSFSNTPEQLKHFSNVHKLDYVYNYNKYVGVFFAMGFDIGLAPMLNIVAHNSKTNNKFREYGAMRVCGVYSNSQLYSDCVEDHVTGLLVENTTDAWYEALCELVENSELRAKIKENTCRCVREDYSMESTLADWERVLAAPRREEQAFSCMLDLKVAVLTDATNNCANLRFSELTYLLGFCEIYWSNFVFQSCDLRMVRDYDVCVCFVNREKDVEMWIKDLQSYGLKNIIIDTMFPFHNAEAYPDVVFTNACGQTENIFSIPDQNNFEAIELVSAVRIAQVTAPQERKYADVLQPAIERTQTASEDTFSLRSPVFLWAELLSRYQGTYVKKVRPFPVRIVMKAGKVFMWRFRKLVQKFKAPAVRFAQRVKERINFMKKY